MDATSTRSLPEHSAEQATTVPSLDALAERSSLRHDASRRFLLLALAFCLGIAATVAWQSYGEVTRAMVANSWPQLAWLRPQPTPVQLIRAEMAAVTPPSVLASAELQQLQNEMQQLSSAIADLRRSVASGLANVGQAVLHEVGVGQQQLATEIGRLAARQQEMVEKLSSTPARAAFEAAPAVRRAPAVAPVPAPKTARRPTSEPR